MCFYYYLLCRDCINNGRIYECNLSRLSFWAQLSVWWVRQLPNHLLQGRLSSLHADTAFMFIIGGLLTVKVLQSRHPDINAYAFCAFLCFAIVISLTMIGIVSDTCILLQIRSLLLHFLPVFHQIKSQVHTSYPLSSADHCCCDILHIILQSSSTHQTVDEFHRYNRHTKTNKCHFYWC